MRWSFARLLAIHVDPLIWSLQAENGFNNFKNALSTYIVQIFSNLQNFFEFQNTWACRRFKEELLNYELKQKAFAWCNFKQLYESSHSSLPTTLSLIDFCHICSTTESKATKTKYCISFKLDKNFNALKQKYGIPQLTFLNDDDIISSYSHLVWTDWKEGFGQRSVFLFAAKGDGCIWCQVFFGTAFPWSE